MSAKDKYIKALGFLFKNSVGRLPYYQKFSPDLHFVKNSDHEMQKFLKDELIRFSDSEYRPKFLDIGARDGVRQGIAKGYDYTGIDIIPKSKDVISGDICHCPQILDNSFDVVFSVDVFEHLKRPWDAADECLRITKSGGLIIHRTLFSYRYHPSPIDYWRFSSQCLEYLFTHDQQAVTLFSGYDIRGRRRDRRGGHLSSKPPIDWMGGFRENWQVLWIGRKL